MNFNGQEYEIKIYKESDGLLGRFIGIDTETNIKPFTTIPDLVTMQAYSGGKYVYYIPKELIPRFISTHSDSFMLFLNAPFDVDVMGKEIGDMSVIYSLYDNNRIRDIGVLYRLLHLAAMGFVPFKYNLSLLSDKFLGEALVKDEIRENFGQFLNLPLDVIPQEYLEYGAKDVIATYKIYFKLIAEIRNHDKKNTLLSHDIQVKGDLALNHIYKNGIGFDLAQRDEWLSGIYKQMDKHSNILASWGWVRGRKGIKDVFSNIATHIGISDLLPKTESGDLSSKSDDLSSFRNHAFIDSYLEYQSLEKATSFVKGITSNIVHPRYNLLVNTGRTSCSKPNFQQLPKFGGIREMFIPTSSEDTFIMTDYAAVELATLAQVTYNTFGYSTMRDKINEGKDLHKYYGTIYYGKNEEDITKAERQTCKAPNFGFSGGLGVDTFIEFSRGYGLELTREVAQEMKDAWFDAFPEMRDYMKNEKGEVFTLTGRKRGNTTFCAEKNTPFQGLAADGAKLAMYNLDKEGFKIVGFCHDEIVCQVPKKNVEKMLLRQEKIMVDSMREVVPDVLIGVESMVSPFYTK